jgi:hypothetical protein
MSKSETTIAKKDNDRVTALAALYQGEKTDASYVFNTAMAMMGVAMAYIVGTITFVVNTNNELYYGLFLLLLPIPLWLVAAYHSLMTLNAMSHGISVRIIEDALFDESELRVKRDLVGSAAGDKIMDITQAKAVHILTTVIVYGGVAILVVGYTIYALHSAKVIISNTPALLYWRDVKVVAIAKSTYSLLAIMVMASWLVGFKMIKEGRGNI